MLYRITVNPGIADRKTYDMQQIIVAVPLLHPAISNHQPVVDCDGWFSLKFSVQLQYQ